MGLCEFHCAFNQIRFGQHSVPWMPQNQGHDCIQLQNPLPFARIKAARAHSVKRHHCRFGVSRNSLEKLRLKPSRQPNRTFGKFARYGRRVQMTL